MAGDSVEREVVRARLAAVAPGWVPRPPSRPGEVTPEPPMTGPVAEPAARPVMGPVADDGAGPAAGDVLDDDAAAGPAEDGAAARRALAAALASYTAAHGHPLEASDMSPGGFRLATRGRVALAAVLVLALVAGIVALRTFARTPSATVPLGAGTAVPAADGGLPGEAATPPVVVHVVGAVIRPGVVNLAAGARVADAVAAAGGPAPGAELAAVNLARVLADGEQVVVPLPGATSGVTSGAGAGLPGPTLVDLNAADAADLDTLPGIGPVLADRIVAWRERNGRFSAVEELAEVTGIGPALLAGVRDLVRVG